MGLNQYEYMQEKLILIALRVKHHGFMKSDFVNVEIFASLFLHIALLYFWYS